MPAKIKSYVERSIQKDYGLTDEQAASVTEVANTYVTYLALPDLPNLPDPPGLP